MATASRPRPDRTVTSNRPSLSPPTVPADVRTLDLGQRHALRQRLSAAQAEWLPRLRALVEPPAPDGDFPAFLLATEPFAWLRAAIGDARQAADLAPATADLLQRFVDAFRDYLRTLAGEDAFGGPARRAS